MKAQLIKLIIISLVVLTICYEDKESRQIRYDFYNQYIPKYSNHTIKVGRSLDKGLYCLANDHIDNRQLVFEVPKEYSISPYYLFPFKFELTDIVRSIPNLEKTIGVEQKIGVLLLSLQIMYIRYANKQKVKEYIVRNKLEQYYDCFEPSDEIKYSFPKDTLGMGSLEQEHYTVAKSLGYPIDRGQELDLQFRWILTEVHKSPHAEAIFPWISDPHHFTYANGIVMSRSMTLRLNEYNKMMKNYLKEHNTDAFRKNEEYNRVIGKNVGAPCFVLFVDLCNHYHPKYNDQRDKRSIILDTVSDHFINLASTEYIRGDEVAYTYTNENTNLILFLHYGFIIPKNKFNLYRFKVENESVMNINQFNLCKELSCVDPSLKDPLAVPKSKYLVITSQKLDSLLLELGRVKNLKSTFDSNKILKTRMNGQIISFKNEVAANLFYLANAEREYKPVAEMHLQSINKAQFERNKATEIENDWKNDPDQEELWRRIKHYQLIYESDVSYKRIIPVHMNFIYDNILSLTSNEMDKLRSKYLMN